MFCEHFFKVAKTAPLRLVLPASEVLLKKSPIWRDLECASSPDFAGEEVRSLKIDTFLHTVIVVEAVAASLEAC